MIDDVNVYELTKKVSNAAAAKWDKITNTDTIVEKQDKGVVEELLHGFVEEIFGRKQPAKV